MTRRWSWTGVAVSVYAAVGSLIVLAFLLYSFLQYQCADRQADQPQTQPPPVTATTTDPLPVPDWDTIDRCQDEIRAGRSPIAWQDETGPCAELPPVWWDHAVQVVDDEAWCTRTCEGEDYRCTPICEDN